MSAPGPAPASAAASRPPPPGWTIQVSRKTGLSYYHNPSTGESRWEYPEGEAGGPSAGSAAGGGAPSAPAAAARPAPSPRETALHAFHPETRDMGVWTVEQFTSAPAFWVSVHAVLTGMGVDEARIPLDVRRAGLGAEGSAAGSAASAAASFDAKEACTRFWAVVTECTGLVPGDALWSAEHRAFVVPPPKKATAAAAAAADAGSWRKRARPDDSGPGAELSAPLAAGEHTARAAMPRIRPHDPHLLTLKRGGGWYREHSLMPSAMIRARYETGRVTRADGKEVRMGSAVNPVEGKHLYDCVRDNGFTRTLEVGMANGMSTLFIAQAVKDNAAAAAATAAAAAGASAETAQARHTAIDPFQTSQWGSVGLRGVEDAGLKDIFEWIPAVGHVALPRLLGEGRRFGFILVDGMHLFDYTLLDLFYANLLCEPGGVIVLDDIRMPAVEQCVQYVRDNWSHWRLITDTRCADTMATFIKVGEDTRKWDFHEMILPVESRRR